MRSWRGKEESINLKCDFLFAELQLQQVWVGLMSFGFSSGVGRGLEDRAISWLPALALEGNPFCHNMVSFGRTE